MGCIEGLERQKIFLSIVTTLGPLPGGGELCCAVFNKWDEWPGQARSERSRRSMADTAPLSFSLSTSSRPGSVLSSYTPYSLSPAPPLHWVSLYC